MKCIIAFLALVTTNLFISSATAAEACAMSHGNGGTPLVVVTDPISATSFGFTRDPNDIVRDAAEAAQQQYGNSVAYDTTVGITVQFTVEGAGVGKVYNLPALNYSGDMSIEAFMLNSLLPEEERPQEDPSPCDPSKNSENGSESSSGGGGGYGYGFIGGAPLWPGTIYVVDTKYGSVIDCQENPIQCQNPGDARSQF